MEPDASKNEARKAHQTILDSLVSLGTSAFDPEAAGSQTAAESQRRFAELVQGTRTTALLPVLNVLIQPGRAPAWLQAELVSTLALLPLRPDDGVRATLEFVFSVHPSSAAAAGPGEAAQPQKQGASITHEALRMAARLLASPPARAAPDVWFGGIAPQLMALLDGHDGLELAKVAAYVIGFGILGRKSFGAPGTAGWTCFAEPMLRGIDPTMASRTAVLGDDAVVDLHKNAAAVLVTDNGVSQSLRRLQTLILSHPNPGLTRRLLGPIMLPLWALSSWPHAHSQKQVEEDYSLPARNLLKIYLRISSSADKLTPVMQNLLYDGSRDPDKSPQWTYEGTSAGICIVSAPSGQQHPAEVIQSRWDEIGPKADALLDLLSDISADDDDGISAVFLDLFSRWLTSKRPSRRAAEGTVQIRCDDDEALDGSTDNPLADVLQGSILQKMMERFPEKLAQRPAHILELVDGLLRQQDGASLAEDETVPILLSLLNLVVTSPGFRRANANAAVVASIESSLETISALSGTDAAHDTAKTAQNLLLFLRYRDEIEDPASETSAVRTDNNVRAAEDRKTYSLVMSYITQADSPPPVRSEGLNLLQGLIQARSPILDIPALLVLLSSLLDENEDFVNLRVIKMFTLLADRHPQSTTRELLDRYVDARETKRVDTRLRFGEALLQVVQRLGETFAGDTAQQVGQTLLEMAGRRGFRPKTKAKQEREEKRKKMRGKDDDDEGNEDKDDEATEDAAERQRNAILAGIVEGWGSREGREDVRIRASALSILAAAIDTSVAGLGAALTSAAVDLCLHVLALETDDAAAILRRAAVVLLLSFVRALHDARAAGRRLGFGLTAESRDEIVRVLQYVGGTDRDGLVRQHAADAIESLENAQLAALAALVPDDTAARPAGLPPLAGLSLDPGLLQPAKRPPRIEEVE